MRWKEIIREALLFLRKRKPTPAPVPEEPVIEEPVIQEPIKEEPVAEEPVAPDEEPVPVPVPIVQEPVTPDEEPIVEKPAVEEAPKPMETLVITDVNDKTNIITMQIKRQ